MPIEQCGVTRPRTRREYPAGECNRRRRVDSPWREVRDDSPRHCEGPHEDPHPWAGQLARGDAHGAAAMRLRHAVAPEESPRTPVVLSGVRSVGAILAISPGARE